MTTHQNEADHDLDPIAAGSDREKRERMWQLLGELLRPARGAFFTVAVLIIIYQLAVVAGPAVIAWGIDVALPALQAGDSTPAWTAGIGYLALAVVGSSAIFAYLRLSARVAERVLYNLRLRIFRHSQQLDLEFHESYTSGRVISRQTNDTESLSEPLEFGLEAIIGAPARMIVIAVSIILMDWLTGLVMLVMLVPGYFLSTWFQRRSSVEYRNMRTHSARLTVEFVETFTGIRAVQAYRRESANDARYAELSGDYRTALLRSIMVFGIYQPALKLLGNLTIAVVIAVGGLRVVGGNLEVGVLLALVLYTRWFFVPIDTLAGFYNQIQSAASALEKISAFLSVNPTVTEPQNPKPLPAGHGTIDLDTVSFGYRDGQDVLPHVDLHIPAGQTVAIVGRTGAGKSTIAKLIARFYDVSSGSIRIDGVDLRELSDRSLRQEVAMVTQESYLFSGTVADNIAIGNPDASRAEIEAAAEAIGADTFIRQLPDGYDTDVLSRGGRLAAGQQQLVSFARAFLADPRVLILDEATSSLDLPSERAVQHGLEQLLGDRTAIIIAHRLATVMNADRVLVVHDGAVVEDGTPAELIAAGGRFADLHRAWQDSL